MGFLELAEPSATQVVDELVAAGCGRIVVQPLMLLAAGHGKNDVPAIVLEARERHPHVEFVFASPLGVVPELLGVAGVKLAAVGAAGLPLIVVARGTSDPDANAEAARAARLLAEWSGARWVDVGYSGVTWPSVPEVLDRVGRLGHERVAVFFWYLATGALVQRARAEIDSFRRERGVEVVDAGYFGADLGLVPVVWQRHAEAIVGVPRTNCDTCSYRAAWPGLDERVGLPRGVGQSKLAASHRHSHSHSH
jgi:sirohydrochlorin cobaltochelatase